MPRHKSLRRRRLSYGRSYPPRMCLLLGPPRMCLHLGHRCGLSYPILCGLSYPILIILIIHCPHCILSCPILSSVRPVVGHFSHPFQSAHHAPHPHSRSIIVVQLLSLHNVHRHNVSIMLCIFISQMHGTCSPKNKHSQRCLVIGQKHPKE